MNKPFISLPQDCISSDFFPNIPLGIHSTMKTGGQAQCLFCPQSFESLSLFRQWNQEQNHPLRETILGGLSNVIIREGGIDGIVIRLIKHCKSYQFGEFFIFEAGIHNAEACKIAEKAGYSGMEFLIGIPGTLGGGAAMNAGAYGSEIGDILAWVDIIDAAGHQQRIERKNLNMGYRQGGFPKKAIILNLAFKLKKEDPEIIQKRHLQLVQERRRKIKLTPVMGTSGSAFKNPPQGPKAWQLIDAVGGRGLRRGGAIISEEHANFIINTGKASAEDLEDLGEEIRQRVFEKKGILLEWEIKILGKRISNHEKTSKIG